MSHLTICGTIETRTAIHVGTGEGGDISDAFCRRNASGDFIVPGTAIAGALRTIATRLAPGLFDQARCQALSTEPQAGACPCLTCGLFGQIRPGEGESEDGGSSASHLFVASGKVSLPPGRTQRIRDGVGIDRASKTASRAGRVKFDYELLPAGSTIPMRLELELCGEDEEQDLLAAILAEWEAGRGRLGGRAARGLGAIVLRDVVVRRQEQHTVADLISSLKSDEPWTSGTPVDEWVSSRIDPVRRNAWLRECAAGESSSPSFAEFTLPLRMEGQFMTRDAVASVRSGFDFAPLLDVVVKDGRAVLPGASLRGALRSQAERIVRTLATLESNDLAGFAQRCPACNPLESLADEPLASCDSLLTKQGIPGRKGARPDQLCMACRLFGTSRQGSRLFVEDAVDESPWNPRVRDFLAIDRFTGGGKDGAKFDAIVPWQPGFKVRIFLEDAADWELGWLMLLLRDLQDGMVPLGFGTAKGFGKAVFDRYTLKHGVLREGHALSAVSPCTPSGVFRVSEWTSTDDDLAVQQEKWVQAFHAERTKALDRQELWTADTYFGTEEIATLYGKASVS